MIVDFLAKGFTPLVANVGLIAILAWAFSYFGRWKRLNVQLSNKQFSVLLGLSAGFTATLLMNLPIEFEPGIFGDARAVPILISGIVGGPIAALITGSMAAAMRLYIGGAGAVVGLAYIILFGVVGGTAGYVYARDASTEMRVKKIMLIMIGTTAVSPLTFLLFPQAIWQKTLLNIWPVMAIANILGTFVIASLLEWDRERRLSEVTLAEREARLTAVLNGSVDAIISVDQAGAIQSANTATSDMFGYALEHMLGQNVRILIDEANQENHGKYMDNYLQTEIGKDIGSGRELEGRKNDGTLFPIHLSIGRSDVNGSMFFTNVIRDLTVLKDNEERLSKNARDIAEQSQRLVLATEAAGIGIWEFDALNDTIIWDQRMVMIHDVVPETFGDKFDDWRSLIKPKEHTRFCQEFDAALAGYMNLDAEFEILTPNKRRRFVYLKAVAVSEYRSSSVRLVGVSLDVTARKEAEEALRNSRQALEEKLNETVDAKARLEVQAQELIKLADEQSILRIKAEAAQHAKGEFLATMSHEIRTPLAGVLGMTDLLLQDDPSPSQANKITRIKDAGDQLMLILNDILDQAKLEAGKLEVEAMNFNLHQLLSGVQALLEPKADEKNLTLMLQQGEGVPETVHGDAARVRQILNNLIGNAIKFSSDGQIIVRVTTKNLDADGTGIFFEVIDQGVGIDEAVQRTLFQRFHQADASTARQYGGSGLGLSICKQLVDLMHGEIGVESTLGEGSRFWFEIPFDVEDKLTTVASEQEQTESRVPSASRPLDILLAEDNELNQFLITSMLDQLGHRVVTCGNGAEAVDCVARDHYDVVLMDIRMPLMDGPTATANIRASKGAHQNIPIVAVTADALSYNMQQSYIDAGMNATTAKPINLKAMLTAIDKALLEDIHTWS